MKHALRSLSLLVALLLGAVAACADGSLPKPTEDEIVKTIQKEFSTGYAASDRLYGGGVASVDVTVGDVRVGALAKRQLFFGKEAEPCWPVKANAKIVTNFNNGTQKEYLRGEWDKISPGEGFLFYKNEFGEWKFKTDSL
jgi:hypothetical protein